MTRSIVLGLEASVQDRPKMLDSGRFGLLMNRASVDRHLNLSCDVLADAYPGQLSALFTPQHGLWGDAQANMIETGHGWHRRLKVPIHSLYSETRRPTSEMLAEIDCLVVDLQDVGTRVYTFIWTMLECLRACADQGVSVMVLDRPNPIGGELVEGPCLDPAYCSFVGGAAIPMRHGLTIGELAKLFRQEGEIDVSLEVVPLHGWSRGQPFAETGRPWLFPSPNLPRLESTLAYPGQVLLEGTNLSEGRGTTVPFEVIGAPFIDPDILMDRLAQSDLPGVAFLPIQFRPAFDKWQGQSCGGVSIHVTDVERFRPVETSIEMISAIAERWPAEFRWLDPPYEYEKTLSPIDIIYGGRGLRDGLAEGTLSSELARVHLDQWQSRTDRIRIYGPRDHRFRC